MLLSTDGHVNVISCTVLLGAVEQSSICTYQFECSDVMLLV